MKILSRILFCVFNVFMCETRQVGEKFRNRSLKFPGLISGCTMDWFSKWPKDALVAVSSHFLKQFAIASSSEVKEQLIEMMGSVHDGVADSCVMYFQRFVLHQFVVHNGQQSQNKLSYSLNIHRE